MRYTAKDILRGAYGNVSNPRPTFAYLKRTGDLKLLRGVAALLPKGAHPFDRYFYGKRMARSIEELFSKQTQTYTGSLLKEVVWTGVGLTNSAGTLNGFDAKRKMLEQKFLLGEYGVATELLEEIETLHGVSMWGSGVKFLLKEFDHGLEANTGYLSELNVNEGIHVYVSIAVHYLSMRAEKDLSHESFDNKARKYLTNYDNVPTLKALFAALMGLIGSDWDFANADAVLFFLADCSLIDRTEFLLNILHSSYLLNRELFDSFAPVLQLLVDRLSFDGFVNLGLATSMLASKELSSFDVAALELLDVYTSGDYIQAAAKASALLQVEPNCYQLYELYVKSLIFSEFNFTNVFPVDSTAANVLESVDHILRKDDNYDKSIQKLSRLNDSLTQFSIARGLHFLISRELAPANLEYTTGRLLLATPFFNPQLSIICPNPESSIKLLNVFQRSAPHSLTLEFWKRYLHGVQSNDPPELPARTSPDRAEFYTAMMYMSKEDYIMAVPLLEGLYQGRIDTQRIFGYPLYEQVTSLLYKGYMRSGALQKALQLYVENYLHNSLLVRGLSAAELVQQIENGSSLEISADINAPLLIVMVLGSPHVVKENFRGVYPIYDNFLAAHGLKKPHELITVSINYTLSQLVFFLRYVCIIEVMAGSFYFHGTEDLENERLRLLQHLCRVDPDNLTSYVEEIDGITQSQFIRQGMRRIDEGKIFVGVEGIRDSADKILRESFQRYLLFRAIPGSMEHQLIDTSGNASVLEGSNIPKEKSLDLEHLKLQAVKVFSSKFALFKELFLELRDRYIWSREYGLDSYLSVRLRHGTIQGQIRSRFESHHLVSSKDAETNAYGRILFWDQSLVHLTPTILDAVQGALQDLSDKVDTLIVDVRDSKVQIVTENRGVGGMFDFRFDDKQLELLLQERFDTITVYESFFDSAVDVLDKRLEDALTETRKFMSEDMKVILVEYLTSSQNIISALTPQMADNEILGEITSCLTETQQECDRISRWFAIPGPDDDISYTLKQIIQLCMASLNNINPEREIVSEIDVLNDKSVVGSRMFPLFDILRVLIDNAVKHSDMLGGVLSLKIHAYIEDDMFTISVVNNLSEARRQANPVQALRERVDRIEAQGISEEVRREGKTGYLKIVKTLRYDLGCNNYSFVFTYLDGGMLQVTLTFVAGDILS